MWSEVLSEYGGHPLLNPENRIIHISSRTLRALDMRGYLKRDKTSGLLHLSRTNHLIFQEAERATNWWHELGEDCSGPNQVICNCQECKELLSSEADDAHVNDIRTRQMVQEILTSRKSL